MFWDIRKYFEILKPVLSLNIYHKVDTKQSSPMSVDQNP